MTQPKRPLLNAEIKSDWVAITSLALSAMTSYNSSTTTYFANGNQQFGSADLLAAFIDSFIGTAIVFFLLVPILGSIRRYMSKDEVVVLGLEGKTTFRKLKIALSIVAVSLVSVFVAYLNAAAQNSDVGSLGSADPGIQIETRPRTCHLQGEDEMCVSAFGIGNSVTSNYELTYKVPREINGYQISSTTWELSFDCEAKTVSARGLKFLDANKNKVAFTDDVVKYAAESIESDAAGLLSEC